MAQKKILLLSVSAGSGHVRAAEALLSQSKTTDYNASATHLDVMNFVTWVLRKIYVDSYFFLLKHAPSFWGTLYRITDRPTQESLLHRFRRWLEQLNCKPLLREIDRMSPDVIICTHFLPAEILSRRIAAGKLHCPVWVQVTDFDLHRMWVQEHITGYFAPSEEIAQRMRDRGIAADAIHVTGIPIMPAFSAPLDHTLCAQELGASPRKKTLLLMGGGAGVGSLPAIARCLLKLKDDFQLITLAGKNAKALDELQTLALHYPDKLIPLGFTTTVERLMACADLAITKPGGLTISECLAMGLPMIINSPIPGQEEENARLLIRHGVALEADNLPELQRHVRHLLEQQEELEHMREKTKTIAQPHAARHVLDIVLRESGETSC